MSAQYEETMDSFLQTQGDTHEQQSTTSLFADLPIANDSYRKLIEYKRNNPNDTSIELTLLSFTSTQPVTVHSSLGSNILGIFRANFAPLSLRINTHFEPAHENCTEGIFLEIYHAQDQETKDMIQWGQYVPERATAAYLVPFDHIDLSRQDYAIVWIEAQRSKTRTRHPCFVPIEFTKRIITNAKAAERTCPFPNHQTLWHKVTTFAKQEYNVRLVSNYLRKRYVDIAENTTMPKAQAAFIMGDKTKIAQEGIHLDLIYGRGLRFVEELINNYRQANLPQLLTIQYPPLTQHPSTQLPTAQQLQAEITRLTQLLHQQHQTTDTK